MTPKALKALRGSIRKWQRIVNGKGVDRGADNCPLCKAYPRQDCRGCPVRKATGSAYCVGTPYYAYASARAHLDEAGKKHAAQREVKFLQSLLPSHTPHKDAKP